MSDIYNIDNAKSVECDACGVTIPGPPLAAAWPAGWLRIYRPNNRGPIDFCPDCKAMIARIAKSTIENQGKNAVAFDTNEPQGG